MSTPVVISPQTGIILNENRFNQPKGSFARLMNCRLVDGFGRILQTPSFYRLAAAWTPGTYYNGGSQTESSTITQALVLSSASTGILAFNPSVARSGTTQLQVLRMTAQPTADTKLTRCLLVVNNYTGLAITLGSTLDIVIEAGGATFKWRKNGGAYTLGLACAVAGTSIDGGNATVYFLAAAGYNPTDTWTWTRTDRLTDADGDGLSSTVDWPYTVTRTGDIYFVDYSGRIMVYEVAGGGIRTAGYRKMFGSHVMIFENHLFVGSFSSSVFSSFAALTNVLSNSDLNSLDDFWATDVNEADSVTLNPVTFVSNVSDGASGSYIPGCRGFSVFNGVLYVYTFNRIWFSGYVSLAQSPAPFSFKELMPIAYNSQFRKPVQTPRGDYILLTSGVHIFNGSELKQIDDKLSATSVSGLLVTSPACTWGMYNSTTNELVLCASGDSTSLICTDSRYLLVYQEKLDQFHARAVSFGSSGLPSSGYVSSGILRLGIALGFATEDVGGSQTTLLNDKTSGASLQVPTIETTDILFDTIQHVVELNGGYIDAYYTSPSGSAYGTTGVLVEVDTRAYGASATTYANTVTWTSAAVDGALAIRTSGRLWRVRISPSVSIGKAAFGFEFNQLALYMVGLPEVEVKR